MPFHPPDHFNIADHFLDDRIREGLGDRIALRTANGTVTYAALQARANRFANALAEMGVRPEERVLIGLPDVTDFPAALFGALKRGAVGVMVNCFLGEGRIRDLYDYTRASAAVVDAEHAGVFARATRGAHHVPRLLVLGTREGDARVDNSSLHYVNYASHFDDPAIWLFSGGTTGRPKGVIQSHASFANTTECYAKGVLGYTADDITLSVPKLYFGYATGSNLLFPLAAGASAVLFPERCTADELFAQIARHRPTILVNVPTMVNHMVSHPEAQTRDLSCLRLATSAGEPLPVPLHRRWDETFGVELLDGLGTAEMWHIFISNRPGRVRPGTLGTAVPGFEVLLCDDDGREVGPGEVGRMRVRGGSRAHGYWQHPGATRSSFAGAWYISGDMMTRDADGYFTYQGRDDDLLKVSGKWFSPREAEECLLEHPDVGEAAVVGIENEDGLAVPVAFVVPAAGGGPRGVPAAIRAHLGESLESYKHPREVHLLAELPRTHLGKVDRGTLKRSREAKGDRASPGPRGGGRGARNRAGERTP
ncbi:MAG: benzoate-CoA ligase family protein [Gemmatimonadota bacterium]|nr:benzoate-CoA ligase family protein [Gemmatimonadota bacterium]MDE2871876.1 benzoate-CoA ligase family protein [Gemmatimonadota bacterium]